MRSIEYPINTTGADGAATGTIDTEPLVGLLTDITLNFNAAAPATTAVAITVNRNGVNTILLNTVVGNTDVTYPITRQLLDRDAAYVGQDQNPNLTGDVLTITVTLANALTPCVTASFGLLK